MRKKKSLHCSKKASCFLATYPRPPLEPELEDVVVPAALDDLVARVVGDVVVLVALEQVVGRHLVAADQEALQGKSNSQ